MSRQIEKLYRKGVPSEDAVNEFIQSNSFPLVETGRVTFVFRGHADEVILRRWISGLNTSQPLQRLEGSDLWQL